MSNPLVLWQTTVTANSQMDFYQIPDRPPASPPTRKSSAKTTTAVDASGTATATTAETHNVLVAKY